MTRKDEAQVDAIALDCSVAIELIAAERQRQVEREGWSSIHDDQHRGGELSDAAVCYAIGESRRGKAIRLWPWDEKWWKPTPDDRVRELVKAGALIVAEIERLQRSAQNGYG